MSRRSMEKYREAIRLYSTTTEGLKSLARRFGLNDCSLRGFIKRHFPEAIAQHNRLVSRQVPDRNDKDFYHAVEYTDKTKV